jgi:hypothetical protein
MISGSEIANAKIQVWASILECDASNRLKEEAKTNCTGMSRQQREKRNKKQKKQEQQEREQCHSSYAITSMLNSVVGSTTSYVGKQVMGGFGFDEERIQPVVSQLPSPSADSSTTLKQLKKKNTVDRKTLLQDIPESSSGSMINDDTQTDGSTSSEEGDDDGNDGDKGHHTQIIQELMTGSATNVDDDIGDTDQPIIDTKEQPGVFKMDEGGEDEGLSPPTIYSRIDCELERNPCFERVWTIRHRLNSNSPLWDAHAHALIRGYRSKGQKGFPPELNSYEQLREHTKFQDISATFNGTDHITGNTVYSNKFYTYHDLVVGWRFANTLVRNEFTGHIGVDPSLINDVVEQYGGGGEPLVEKVELDRPLAIIDVCNDIENQFPTLLDDGGGDDHDRGTKRE